MLTNYTERKQEVLSAYEQFEEQIKVLERMLIEAGLPSPIAQFNASLDDARRKASNIRADRFRLMIAGEAKSGKSTFINAYLGVALMPMDVKQCTSSIVEIKYGKEFRLAATYADGRVKECKGDSDIKSFLKINAALDDKYRDIPVPTINHDLLVKYGQKSQNSVVSIPESEIRAFLTYPEITAANIYNIDNYDAKILQYINEYKDNWREIVVKIELFFPFEEESLKGIEIIDSPGVCARGGVAEITANYIENADAIIFLKPISGQALESSQFTEFMKNASVERNKNALFLVLTRAADLSDSDLNRQRIEADKQFSDKLPKNNIIVVDSKAELYAIDFNKSEDVMHRLQELNSIVDENGESKLEKWVKGIFFDSNNNKKTFVNMLKKVSNFAKIDEVLSIFGRKAHYIAWASLLEVISKVYTRVIGDLEGHIARFKEKAEDPTELAKKIAELKQELDDINDKIAIGIDNVVNRYNGDGGSTRKEANKEASSFETEINQIREDDPYAFDELRKSAMNKVDKFKSKQDELQRTVIVECNKELIKISSESEIPFTSLEPDFSEGEFNKIKLNTKDSTAAKNAHTTGFFSPETTYTYSATKHFKLVKDKTLSKVKVTKNDVIQNLDAFVDNIRSLYVQKLSENANAKKTELDAIYQAKLNAEQIKDIIDNLKELLTVCEEIKRNIEKIKGGIEKYVQ